MCYSYYEGYERRTKKDSVRTPEMHKPETSKDQAPEAPAEKSPQTEGTLWTFLARRRREFEVSEPRIDRIREKV
ncbi:hypothetical protein StoSoilA2_09370 [Arthrobacter sp. StoSoilA2]|uniref:hypothetical protein n=1 Tax=unclassified Arthrobacter TaxID=235627 RepID=UPI001CC7B38D|nr:MULTISPECIES: hypothetical protein [unclassified Arthrobacter]MDR6685516.1 hypothetical protein [Arthrobacter sp. 1088]BCW34881.1 hypothetical protein StoSoilA2_09370 [Arthrobacter sp. StoSoilA2]BCW50864.1 hypothetical protein StoSoilB13_32060 [Arthrobacter sp. StoSoilB13]